MVIYPGQNWAFNMVNMVILQSQPGHLSSSTWSFNNVNLVILPGQLGHLTRST